MPTPASRTPVRVARGTYSNLNSSVSDIQEGEIVYATDQDKLYVKEGSALVSTQAALPATNAVTDAAQTFTSGQRGEVRHSVGSTFSVDMNDANNFHFETNANFTVAVTQITKGQCGSIFIEYGGSHTGSFPTTFKFVGGAAGITLTSTANAIDRIDYIVLDDTLGAEVITCNFTANYVA